MGLETLIAQSAKTIGCELINRAFGQPSDDLKSEITQTNDISLHTNQEKNVASPHNAHNFSDTQHASQITCNSSKSCAEITQQNQQKSSHNVLSVTPECYKDNNVSNIGMINAYSRNKRLGVMVICAALGLVFCLMILTIYKGDLSGEVVGIISTVAGIFGACLKDAYSFEFGSSRGSREKDERISATILGKLKP